MKEHYRHNVQNIINDLDNRLRNFVAAMRDLYSRAVRRYFRPKNLPKYMMFTKHKNSGFFLGTIRILGQRYYICKPNHKDGHILVVGGTASGKSSCIAIPTLESWDTPIIAVDIKGEISAHYADLHKSGLVSLPYIVFDPKLKDGWGYDPYYWLSQGGEENLAQNARDLTLALIPLPVNIREPFWVEAAQNILTAAILFYFDTGVSFSETILGIQTTPVDKLCKDIVNSNNLIAKMYINQISDLKVETLAAIGTELGNRIMVFVTDALIMGAFKDYRKDQNCFTWEDLDKNNVFLRIPEDKIEQWSGAIILILNQLFRMLERRPDKTSTAGKGMQPVLVMVDEAARLGKIESLKTALTTLRSKNVTISLFVQSLSQLDEIYGRDARRVVMDNCSFLAILNATDADSQEYFSKIVGTREVVKESRGYDIDPRTRLIVERGVNRSLYCEPIIYPHEFTSLKDIALITPDGYSRIKKRPYYNNQSHLNAYKNMKAEEAF